MKSVDTVRVAAVQYLQKRIHSVEEFKRILLCFQNFSRCNCYLPNP